MNKYALFLGCTIPARGRNYEVSARNVARKVGIELLDLESFVCCGFPIKAADPQAALIVGAYNLALAQEKGLDVCTLCSSCTSALTELVHHLSENTDMKSQVNEKLIKVGLTYEGGVKVRHFARVLYEEVGPEEVKKHFLRGLDGLRIAVHYGCHYLKPSEIYDQFDNPESPHTLDSLVALTGAKVIDYGGKEVCCGGPVLPVDEKTALSVAKGKLDAVVDAGADALCLVCPFCAVMYDSTQKSIENQFGTSYKLPVLYLPQILGLAMGYDRKELGLNINVVKTKHLNF
jgi:heterodisulfide reductase subunit B